MAIDTNKLQQIGQQALSGQVPQRPPENYGAPQDPIDALPNSEKLTPFERGVFKALPRINEKANALFGEGALEKFNNSIFGKALSVLDVGAEGVERTLGLLSQMTEPGFNYNELKSAWYAGSMTADLMNLPQIQYGDKKKTGVNPYGVTQWEEVGTAEYGKGDNIVGLRVPTDLPGMQALAAARSEIQALVNQGVSYKDALAQVKNNYTDNLGALALRSQLNDTYFHIALDPLNYIMPNLAPIDALQATRIRALEKFAVSAEDAAKVSTEILSHVDEINKAIAVETDLAKIGELTAKAQDAAKLAEEVAQGQKTLTTFEKAAIMLTGGDPFGRKLTDFDKVLKGAGKVLTTLEKPFSLFKLTPASQAQEAIVRVSDSIGSNLVQRLYNSANFEEDFARAITRVSNDSAGVEFGHAMMTVEGRSVQGLVKGADAVVSKTFESYKAVENERQILEVISKSIGQSGSDVLLAAEKNADSLLTTLTGKNPILDLMIQNGEVTPDVLRNMAGMFKEIPYNKDMFIATVLDQIEGHAMQQAITQFGVKARGTVTRWSDAIKAAESLAFLRLSPGYPIRNKINNDVTMIARGVFGVFDQNFIDNYWSVAGYIPKRLSEGFSPAELKAFEQTEGAADKLIQEALKGGNYGAPEKVKEFFSNLNLGKLDTAGWGRNLESKASMRAFTTGHVEYMNKYARYSNFATLVDNATLQAVENVLPGFGKEYDNFIRAAGAVDSKLDDFLKSNVNLNSESVIQEASRILGTDAKEALGTDLIAYLQKELPDAIKGNRVPEMVQTAKQKINEHLEDLFQKQLENVVEHTKAQTVAGGPQIWNQRMGDVQDMFYDVQIEHSYRTSNAAELARQAQIKGDFTKANALWTKDFQDSQMIFDRMYRRLDAYMQGMDAAQVEMKAQGINLPQFGEVRQSFQELKTGWQDFYKNRNEMYREFFDAKLKGVEYRKEWDQIQAETERLYYIQKSKENELMQSVDDAVAAQIPDPQLREAYMGARDEIAAVRQIDAENLITTKQRIADGEPANKVWNEFWTERRARLTSIKEMEAQSRAIMQGDVKTASAFMPPPTAVERQAGEGAQAAVRGSEIPTQETLIKQTGADLKSTDAMRAERRRRNLKEEIKFLEEFGADKIGVARKKFLQENNPELFSQSMEQASQEIAKNIFGNEADAFANMSYRNIELLRQTRPGSSQAALIKNYISEIENKVKGLSENELRAIAEPRGGNNRFDTVTSLAQKELTSRGLKPLEENAKVSQEVLQRVYDVEEKIAKEVYGDSANLFSNASLTTSRAAKPEQAAEYEKRLAEALKDFSDEELQAAASTTVIREGNLTPLQAVAKKELERRTATTTSESKPFIADVTQIMPEPMPIDFAEDLMAYGRSHNALDAMVDAARSQATKQPMILADLPQEVQTKVMAAVERSRNEFGSVRNQAVKYAAYKRDSALLNYNRRTNFDAMVSNVFPFAFWTTGSMMKWAIHSIDRPAMLTTYLRTKKILATAGLKQEGAPSRTQGKIKISLPFAPEWMGDQYIDPLRMLLPFDSFVQPFEQARKDGLTDGGRAQRLLEQRLQDGDITQDEYDNAIQDESGPLWEQALSEVKNNDADNKYDGWDFATSMSSPHAPLMWAYNAARGHPEDIGPFAPATRLMRNAATMLGVPDFNNASWNVEAKIRRTMGLNSFDKWDDYRIDRALSDLAGDGTYSVQEVQEAAYISAQVQKGALTPEQAKDMSQVYSDAITRADQEYTGGTAGGILSFLGISVTTVPKGETELRKLQGDFGRAFEKYNAANESIAQFAEAHPTMTQAEALAAWTKQNPKMAQDSNALAQFFNDHPEYETRLGLFDPPDVKINKFLVDQVWKYYNEMPKVNQDEIRDMLGPDFQQDFLDKETRNPEGVSAEQLSIYLKLMGGEPVGTLTATETALLSLVRKELTDPETANRVQVFYDQRKQNYGNYYELQNQYYAKDKKDRSAFIKANPELAKYWDWRRDFMEQNPDLVPYLTDNEKDLQKAREKSQRGEGAVPTAREINVQIDPLVQETIAEYRKTGDELPPVVIRELERTAAQYGMTVEQLMNIMGLQ